MTEEPVELLLVEDNAADVELTVRVLKKHNVANHIRIARDGAEALDFLFSNIDDAATNGRYPTRLILLDLKLPKVDGLEVLGRIKADARTKSIPVVALTSSREDQDLYLCYELGVNGYIVKPVDFVQFSEAMRQLGLYWLLWNELPNPGRKCG